MLISGFAWPLGKFQYALWPWKQNYFMFHFGSNRGYKMVIVGRLRGGKVVPLPVDRIFGYQVASGAKRYDEIPRTDAALERLARYVYRRTRETEPAKAAVLDKVFIIEASWPLVKGKRVLFDEAERTRIVSYRTLKEYRCPAEPPRPR